MCDRFVPSCSDYDDFVSKFKAKQQSLLPCIMKNYKACSSVCKSLTGPPNEACIKCLNGQCDGVEALFQCEKCMGILGKPANITKAMYEKCVQCGGDAKLMSLTHPSHSSGLLSLTHPSQKIDWMMWGGIAIAVLLVIAIIYGLSMK